MNKKKKVRKNNPGRAGYLTGLFLFIIVVGILGVFVALLRSGSTRKDNQVTLAKGTLNDSYKWPDFSVDLLTPNSYSRPQRALETVGGIVVHYTANPGTSAKQNRDYFESLAQSAETAASSHFIVGLEGEIIQCIPLTEISYASNNRNDDTISIETCHPDATGKFTEASYDSLVQLCAWLCLRYSLAPEDIIRHYDVTGKICPKYFVEDEDAWVQFRQDVGEKMKTYPLMEENT